MPRIAPPPPAPARLPAAPPIPRPLPLPSASRPGLEEEPSARESFDSLPEMPPPAPAPSREAPTALSLNRQALNRQAMGVPAYSAKLPSLPPLEAPARVDTGRGSGSIWILLGGFAAAACLVIAALALMPRDGQLYVDVRDQSGNAIPLAEVFIDGQKQCDASPCVVRKIEAGHKLVQVLAPGHANQAPVTANIESGEENRLVVTLASATGSLSAKSAQPNVRVFVDGDDRGTLPVELDDLTPGAHELRFDAGPLYTAEKRSIDVVAGEAVDVGEVRLDIAKAIVNVEVDAKATRVLFSRAGERAKVLTGPFPRAVELDPSATWKLVAVRAGYDDVEANVDFADGVAEKTVRLAWREPATTDAPTRVSAADLPTTTPSSSVASAPVVASTTPAAAPADDDGAKSSEVAAEMGTLNVNSIPVSKVLVDGAPMGETPRLDISLAPGTHTVTFIHPELGRKSVSVQIKPGVLTRAAVKLRD
jgi:hypothetical protein